ncbi:hypothetical protein LTR84_006666 [Exophiala bonariae]|uniref:Xylanolytic transcriptional activator regulatory domain-containing protein n=1 Tax=Exophiala bonariae TaxID=1690606 RepID=A0AAV9N1X6_9EURO|nr:hypothetical protein LTR84_006666 [Exophiala bonariae]
MGRKPENIDQNGKDHAICAASAKRNARSRALEGRPLRKERGPPESRSHSAQLQTSHPPEFPSTVQHHDSQSDFDAHQGDPMHIDVSAFETDDLEFGIDANPETLPLVSDRLSFPGQELPDPQAGGAIDWSYLNFPISPLGNHSTSPRLLSAVSDGSPQAFRLDHISPVASERHEQRNGPVIATDSSDDVLENSTHNELEAPRIGEWSSDFSLDERPGYSSQLIGLSGETDPFLLRHYQYDARDTFRMFALDFRKVTDDGNMLGHAALPQSSQIPSSDVPIQFVMTDEKICNDDVKIMDKDFAGSSTEAEDYALLYKIVPIDLGSRLLKLFFKFIQPSYPVLSSHDHNGEYRDCKCSTGLRAAVYALAAPYYFLDDYLSVDRGYQQPPTEELWGIAHRGFQRDSRKPHLALVQLGLLFLHRPPQNYAVADVPSSWATACLVLAAAETLGLNLDPSHWKLPPYEIRLRKRLWWLVHVEHTWRALVLGRPSHITDSNWDVSGLTADDFDLDDIADPETRNCVQAQSPFFMALCSLSTIANKVLDAL